MYFVNASCKEINAHMHSWYASFYSESEKCPENEQSTQRVNLKRIPNTEEC